MLRIFAVLVVALLAGCAVAPPVPSSRSEWNEVHTKFFPGKSAEQVLEAAEKVLRNVDHDFVFDYPDGKLVGTRRWSVYMVLAGAMGIDYWTITTVEEEEGTRATVQISRAEGAILPTPTFGAGGATGATVTQSSTPGNPVQYRPPYDLFWSRVSYVLMGEGSWVTCKDFKAGKKSVQKMNLDVMCSVTTDDNPIP